jgi:hypothetical protein
MRDPAKWAPRVQDYDLKSLDVKYDIHRKKKKKRRIFVTGFEMFTQPSARMRDPILRSNPKGGSVMGFSPSR